MSILGFVFNHDVLFSYVLINMEFSDDLDFILDIAGQFVSTRNSNMYDRSNNLDVVIDQTVCFHPKLKYICLCRQLEQRLILLLFTKKKITSHGTDGRTHILLRQSELPEADLEGLRIVAARIFIFCTESCKLLASCRPIYLHVPHLWRK